MDKAEKKCEWKVAYICVGFLVHTIQSLHPFIILQWIIRLLLVNLWQMRYIQYNQWINTTINLDTYCFQALWFSPAMNVPAWLNVSKNTGENPEYPVGISNPWATSLFILKNWNFDKSWRESKQSYVSKIWIWNGKQHALNERFFYHR